MSILKRFVTAPSEASELPKFDVTTYKALVAQRLLTAACIVSAVSFLGCLVFGEDDMAKFIFETFLIFFGAAVLGVNMGQYGLQRFSSKEREEAKERGRESARMIHGNGTITKERPAMHADNVENVVMPPAPVAERRVRKDPVSQPEPRVSEDEVEEPQWADGRTNQGIL